MSIKHTHKLKMTTADIINKQARSFKYFLQSIVLDEETWRFLNKLIDGDRNIYVFSGVIRDFLTGNYSGIRDFDCVLNINTIKDNDIISFLRKNNYKKNSFGGLKLSKKNLIIDTWLLKETWGIKEECLSANPISLISTAFFNFSAIVYDLKHEKFIFDDNFCKFLETNAMDVVYEKNPNISLCLVNIYHYHKLFGYGIFENLIRWIIRNYKVGDDLESIQLRHFHEILYSQDILDSFFLNLIEYYNYVQNRLE